MKRIYSKIQLECGGHRMEFNVSLIVDTTCRYFRFHFICDEADKSKIPLIARSFDIITDYEKQIVFNRLAGSRNDVQECINTLVCRYIQDFSYPDLRPKADSEQ